MTKPLTKEDFEDMVEYVINSPSNPRPEMLTKKQYQKRLKEEHERWKCKWLT